MGPRQVLLFVGLAALCWPASARIVPQRAWLGSGIRSALVLPGRRHPNLFLSTLGLWCRLEKVAGGYQCSVVAERPYAAEDAPVLSPSRDGSENLIAFQDGANVRRVREDGSTADVIFGHLGFGSLCAVENIDGRSGLELVYSDGRYLTIFSEYGSQPVYRSRRTSQRVMLAQGDRDDSLELFIVQDGLLTMLDGRTRRVEYQRQFEFSKVSLHDWTGDGDVEVFAVDDQGRLEVQDPETGAVLFNRIIANGQVELETGDVDGNGSQDLVMSALKGGFSVLDKRTGAPRSRVGNGLTSSDDFLLCDLDGDGSDEAVTLSSRPCVFDLGKRRMEWASVPQPMEEVVSGHFLSQDTRTAVGMYKDQLTVLGQVSGSPFATNVTGAFGLRSLNIDDDPEDEVIVFPTRASRAIAAYDLARGGVQMRSQSVDGWVLDCAAGDLDRDGREELVLAGYDYWRQNSWFATYDGPTLTLERTYEVDSLPLQQVQIGDLEGDGLVEIVVLDQSGRVSAYRLGQARPLFGPRNIGASAIFLLASGGAQKSRLYVGDIGGRVTLYDLPLGLPLKTVLDCREPEPVTALFVGDVLGSPQVDVLGLCGQKLWASYVEGDTGIRRTESSRSDRLLNWRQPFLTVTVESKGQLAVLAEHQSGALVEYAVVP